MSESIWSLRILRFLKSRPAKSCTEWLRSCFKASLKEEELFQRGGNLAKFLKNVLDPDEQPEKVDEKIVELLNNELIAIVSEYVETLFPDLKLDGMDIENKPFSFIVKIDIKSYAVPDYKIIQIGISEFIKNYIVHTAEYILQ